MQKEQLFFWPLCLYTYAPGEGNDWQFPSPNYENGDIFLSWGSVAVKAYANYKPELAVKYVKNVLAQYAKDGLAFQRYGRAKQDGLGDDILSGNSLSVVGLYQGIYGINPLYNRLYLEPHITAELAGTQVRYNYRNQKLLIDLNMNRYAVSNERFKIIAATNFGFFNKGNELFYFNGNTTAAAFKVTTAPNQHFTLDIKSWQAGQLSWSQTSSAANKTGYQINNLKKDSYYTIQVNKKMVKRLKSSVDGSITFEYTTGKDTEEVLVTNK
jgi:hypothetical protein